MTNKERAEKETVGCPICGEQYVVTNTPHPCYDPAGHPSLRKIGEKLKKRGDYYVLLKRLCGLLGQRDKTIIKQAERIELLEKAIEWAVERMDEEPAKEDLKQALGTGGAK